MEEMNTMPSFTNYDDFVSSSVSNGFASGTSPSYLRLAMHGDFSEKTLQEIADNNALAERMGVTPELATDNPDLKTEDTIRQMEQNPAAENFVKQDERHIAALKEDGQGLLDTYNVLVDKNMIFGYDGKDNNEGTATNEFMPYGTDINNATKRSQLQQRLSQLGLQAWENSGNREMQEQLREQILAVQKEMADTKVDSSIAKAWEQMHRMFTNDIPEAAFMAGQGAIAGGAVGSAVPLVGTAAGMAAGATAGFFGGMYKSVSKSEIGNFYAEMLTMKDDAGNYVDAERAKWGAYAYGNLSAVVETASDAFFGKMASKAVAPVKAAARSYFKGEVVKDAIRSFVKDTSMWRVVGPFAGGMAATTLTESTEEATQSLLSTAIQNSIKRSLNEEGKNYFRGDIPIIGEEGWKEAGANFLETMEIAPWFFLAPGLMRFSADMHLRNKAIQFVDGNKALAESLENSKTKQASPLVMEKYLQSSGLTGEITIPSSDAMNLQRNGVDLASVMGWDVSTMQEAAELGQDLTFPLARLQANLDKDSMLKVTDVMRESPESISLKDAQEINDNAKGDFDEAARLWQEENEQNRSVANEAARIEQELNEVVRSTGGLQAQVKSSTDKGTTSGQYVRNTMRLVGAFAQRIEAATGIPVAETLSRFNFRGVMDAMRVKERLAEFGMDNAKKLVHIRKIVDPDLQAAWGKISKNEFIKHFSGMNPRNPKQARKFALQQVKRIEENFGPGFWAPNNTGMSPDKVAISAPEWHSDSKFGFRAPDEQVDLNEFLDRILRTNEEALGSSDIDEVLRKYGMVEDQIMAGMTDGLLQAAYHGTPHRFDEFSLDNIGGGEGAQAHGWGLYFAQDKEISDTRYRQRLTDKKNISEEGNYKVLLNGKEVDEDTFIQATALLGLQSQESLQKSSEELKNTARDVISGVNEGIEQKRKKIAFYENALEKINDGEDFNSVFDTNEYNALFLGPEKNTKKGLYNAARSVAETQGREQVTNEDIAEVIERFRKGQESSIDEARSTISFLNRLIDENVSIARAEKETGQLFEVDIPENDVLLDEQKSFDEQPEKVKQAFREILGVEGNTWSEIKDFIKKNYSKLEREKIENFTDHNAVSRFESVKAIHQNRVNNTGRGLYGILENSWATNEDRAYRRPASKTASLMLNDHGVKGITYDGNVDGRCFVVFDDKAVNVLQTFYQSQGSAKARGATYVDPTNDRYVIELFNGANFSTLIHELGHVFTLEMERLVNAGMANEQLTNDMIALNNWTSALYQDDVLKKEYNKYQKDSVYGGRAFESLTSDEVNEARDRARKEWFARGFEQYLAEGRAPSSKLQGIFQRFARWLSRVYKQIRDLDVQITDEVRAVFDRMLAAEEDMDIAASQANISDFSKQALDDLGVRGRERLRLEGLINDAKTEAANQLRRARDKGHEAQLKRWGNEARELIKKDPAFQVKKLMRSEDLFFDYDEIVDLYGKAEADSLSKLLPNGVSKDGKGNTSLEATAADYGFDSGLDMIDAIKQSKGEQQFIKDYIDERQAEHDAQFSPVDDLLEQPEIAEMQEEIAIALQAKIEGILNEKLYQKEREGKTLGGESVQPTQEQYEDFGSRANWIATREELQHRAENKLNIMRMEVEIRPESFRKQAMREMQNERNFILRKDWGRAIEANYKARLNIAMAKLATERQKLVNRLQRETKQALESKSISGGIKAAVYQLSQKFVLQDQYTQKALNNIAGKTNEDILKAIRDLEAKGHLTAGTVEQDIFTSAGKPWNHMTWNEYSKVHESVLGLIKAERYRNYIDTNDARVEIEDLCRQAAKNIRKENKERPDNIRQIRTTWQKMQDKAADLLIYGGLNLETMTFLLEKKDFGLLWRMIIKPINKATWKRSSIMREMTDKWKSKDMLGMYSLEEQENMKKTYLIRADGENKEMTRLRAVMILLNCGNAGNYQRLLNSGYTQEHIMAAINSLEEKDTVFAQNVWNYFETFKKESFDIEERITKSRPKAVIATPVPTKFGELKGGYFPIMYDSAESTHVPNAEEFGSLTNYMVPASVDHSFLKERNDKSATGWALKLDDIMVIPQHLSNVAHTLAFREPIYNVARILQNKDMTKAIEETYGPAFLKAMEGNVKYIAGQRPATNWGTKLIGGFRKRASIFSMGYSLCTTLVQAAGLLTTVNQIGVKHTLKGLGHSIKEGVGSFKMNGFRPQVEMYQEVCAKSEMMKNRIDNVDREMSEAANAIDMGTTFGGNSALGKIKRMNKWLERNAFKPIGWMQMITADMPTWKGAYLQAIEEKNMTEEEAIEYADAIVERTQVGGADKNLSRWQQGDYMKAVTMFYSYFGCLYNLYIRSGAMAARKYDTKSVLALASLMLPMFVEPIVTGALTRKNPPDDDWEKQLKWAIKEAALNPFNMLPIVRDIASYVSQDNAFASYRVTPLADSVVNGKKAIAEMYKVFSGDKKADGVKSTLAVVRTAGLATGNPLLGLQTVRILEETLNVMANKKPEFEIGNLIRKRNAEKK